MSITYAVDQLSPQQWSDVCRALADYSIYQTWGFGEISASDTGTKLSRMVIRDGDAVIGAAQVRIKKLPMLKAGLAYVYFGPMGSRCVGSGDGFASVLRCVRDEYVERRGLELRLVPNFWERPEGNGSMRFPKDSGFFAGRNGSAYRTLMVDLSPGEEELRKNLAQKWRNGLNQAEKRGVAVEDRTDDAAMQQFEKLYETMWSRKQFETGVTVSSFRRLQQLLPSEEKLAIQLAYKDGALAAGQVCSTLGDTCVYLLGASNEMGRECKASYILQWRAMVAAKKSGARWYDLGGIDPLRNPGVHHFKSGLGGMDISFVGEFEAHSKGVGRYLVPIAERVYRTLSPMMQRNKEKAGSAALRPAELNARSEAPCPVMAK